MKNKNKENDTKKIVTMLVLIATLMIVTTGATYAYFAISATNNNVITGTAASVSLTLNVQKSLPTAAKPGNGYMVPQRETALGTAINSTNGCVDSNSNVVCQVYTVTITNGSNATVRLKGTITFGNSSTLPNLKWRSISGLNTLSGTTAAANVSTEQTFIASESITGGASKTYYILVWINAQMSGTVETAQTDTGTYNATIKFVSVDASGNVTGGVTSTITS